MIMAPFELLQLPKLSRSSRTSVPVLSDHENLFIGVSSSAINKLSLRPPQVLSAHAVAPGTNITAILASESSVVAYASVNRGKYHLNLLKQDDDENGGTKPNTVVEVSDEISALYASPGMSQIAALSKNTSKITGYSADDLAELWTDNHSEAGELVCSALITDSESLESSATNFIVVTQTKKSLQLKTFALDNKNVHSLMTINIDGNQANKEVVAQSHFSQNKDLLYQVTGSHIYVYRIPDGTVLNSFEVDGDANITGIIALPNNNVAIARDTSIELIDCSYQSHIHSLKLNGKGPLDLLAFSESASAIIAMQDQKVLLGLTVVPTQGTLLESVGKGSANKAKQFPFADIFGGFTTVDSESKEIAESQLNNAQREFNTIVAALEDAISKRDGLTFAEIVTYMKNPKLDWVEWQASGQAAGPDEQDLVYEETDRNVDRQLIFKVCELAFLPRFKPFLPIGVAVYFLTHPLFPTGEPKFEPMLRGLEKSDAILYRQALVSLAGITAKDLVLGLINQDDATFLDAAIRLQEDYGSQQILQGIKEAFGNMRSISSLGIVIERLSRFPETVGLMGPFIDAMGLLAWDVDHIKRLRTNLSNQIETIECCFQADAAITELFNAVGLDASESSIPSSSAELRNTRDQRKRGSDETENQHIPKYGVETLVL